MAEDRVAMQIRMPRGLREKIYEAAERNDLSLSQFCTDVLAYEVGFELPEE